MRQQPSKLIWDLLILKILDSRPEGEALTFEIARELAVLDAALRQTYPSHPIEGGIFGAGFVICVGKGVWRITAEGRNYVRSLHSHNRRAAGTDQTSPQAEPGRLELLEIEPDDNSD